jgi:trans-aconitate 2-methyltransferase
MEAKIMAYEFDATKYEQASAHQQEWGRKLIQELNLAGGEAILDLGCGDGGLTAQLAALVPRGRVLGIDASQAMITGARRHQASNLAFVLRDITALDFDGEFDVVFSNATLHWVKDHDAMLQHVYRSLKPGGVLRFNFAADGNCSHFLKVIRQGIAEPLFAAHFLHFAWPWFMPTLDEYTALVRRRPFEEVRVWGENADRYFPGTEALIRWIDQPSLVPFVQHLAAADKERFRCWVIDRMIAATQQPDGRCFETFRRINVLAKKQPQALG